MRPEVEILQRAFEEQQQRRARRNRYRRLRNVLLFFLGAAISGGLCYLTACGAYRMGSEAMRPTLEPGDRVLVATFLRGTMPDRGDLVLFRSPVPEETRLSVKRVIAVPGDTVEVKQGRLWRNGGVAEEPFVREPMAYDWGPVTCQGGHVLVLGDNRNQGMDSHNWSMPGPEGTTVAAPQLPVQDLEGKAFAVVYPPLRMTFFRASR